MSKVIDALKANAAYAFIAAGLVWLGVAFITSSYLVLWPVLATLLGGLMLRVRPGDRLTWAWASSAAVLGFLLAGWQAYESVGLLGGEFATVATTSFLGFGAFALAHLLLLYAGYTSSTKA